MASESILVFRDEEALTIYVKSLAARDPAQLRGAFELLLLERDGEPLRPAIAGAGSAGLEAQDGIAERVKAAVDRDGRAVTLKTGRFLGRKKFQLAAHQRGQHLAELGRLKPRESVPSYDRIAFWANSEATFKELIVGHLRLGLDDLSVAELEDGWLVVAQRPSFHLVQVWAELRVDEGVSVFYEGERRGLFFAWGCGHPFEAWLPADVSATSVVLVRAEGQREVVATSALRDVGQVLDLRDGTERARRWEASEASARIALELRFTGRSEPATPELWVLPTSRRAELEGVLEATPEDELKNLLMAILTLSSGEEVFVLREVLSGRVPHLLPQTKRTFAPLSRSVPNLYLPCDVVLEPPLRPQRYAEAFEVRPGEITLLEGRDGEAIRAAKFEERSFRPLSQLVDFIFSGEAERIAARVLEAPFDFGEFKDVDLIDPRAREAAPSSPKVEVRPKEPEAEVEGEDGGLFRKVRNFVMGRRKDAEPESKDEPEASGGVVDEQRWELEEALVRREGGPEGWYDLASRHFAQSEVEEGVRCAESGLWLAQPASPAEARGQELLQGRLGEAEGALESCEELYAGVLSFALRRAEFDADAQAQRTRVLWRQLQRAGRLRKKSRWLLWRELLKLNGDEIEEARQREDLLSELVLKGVEDREVPPFVRAHLMEATRHENSASGGDKALIFLERACEIVSEEDNKPVLGLALATLGYAYVELGESERGLALAEEASRLIDGRMTQPIEAVCAARVAALRERAGRGGQSEAFESALALLGEERKFSHRKGLEKWFKAIADARLAARVASRLVQAGLEVVGQYRPQYRALLLKDISAALVSVNETAHARDMVRELLALPKSEFTQTEQPTSSDSSGREIIYFEELTATLAKLEVREAVDREEATLILEKLRELAEQINEFSIDMALVAFRCPELDFVAVGDELAGWLSAEGHSYASLNIQLAVLRRLAETKRREEGWRRLPGLVQETWEHDCASADCDRSKDYHRLRLLQRIVERIPAFGLSPQGIALIDEVSRRAQEMNEYVHPNLTSVCAISQVKLGQRPGLMESLEGYAEQAAQTVEAGKQSGANTDLTFWVLESVVEGVAQVGETQRGLALTQRITELTRGGLSESWTPTQFWLYRALIKAGRAGLQLGDAAWAEALFEEVFGRIKEHVTFGFDRIDLLNELIGEVKALTSAKRFDLTGDILAATQAACKEVGEFGQEVLLNLVNTVADDIVRGESAYAMALKRWKGDEERSIRDRIAIERISEVL